MDNKNKVSLVFREPGKAYVADMLWLPKALVAVQAIKNALEYYIVEKGEAIKERLWEETEHHLICPREYLHPNQYSQFPFPFVDLTPKVFPKTNVWCKVVPRNENQVKAYDAMKRNPNGILNLGCGKGKTVLALKRIEELGCPSLIVVHNGSLMQQWLDRISEHVELPVGEKVGIIQEKRFEWDRPIVVAMIHTLVNLVEAKKIPPEFRRHFGLVVYDEVHHLSASEFSKTAPVVMGHRLGLTATADRLDGKQFVYQAHLGGVFFTDLEQDLIPRFYFQRSPITIDLTIPEVCDVNGEVNIPKIRSYLGNHLDSNNFRAKCIQGALDEGRKILAISHSKDMLINLNQMFPRSGLIIAETPQEDRPGVLVKSQLTFSIATLGVEGIDDDNLDTLFILTPFSSPNDLQQVMGRVQRWKPDKKTPVVVVIEDARIGPMNGLCKAMKKILKEKGMAFEVFPVPTT